MSSKILDDMRDVMRRRHYSIRTERSYCEWVKRFVLHFNMKSRDDLSEGEKKIETYLTFLARDRNVAPSTQNQALNALVFLYKHVLKQPLNEKINAERAAKKVKIPVVLTRDETKRIILALTGIHQLVVKLLYGSGLRIIDCLRLRVHDMEAHLRHVKIVHEGDLANGGLRQECGIYQYNLDESALR